MQITFSTLSELPLYFLYFIRDFFDLSEGGLTYFLQILGLALSAGFQIFVLLAVYSVSLITIGFQYFNLVEQKDALGLVEKVKNMGEVGSN